MSTEPAGIAIGLDRKGAICVLSVASGASPCMVLARALECSAAREVLEIIDACSISVVTKPYCEQGEIAQGPTDFRSWRSLSRDGV